MAYGPLAEPLLWVAGEAETDIRRRSLITIGESGSAISATPRELPPILALHLDSALESKAGPSILVHWCPYWEGWRPMHYEVVLLDSARQVARELELADQRQLAYSLREELWCEETESTILIKDWSIDLERQYFATSLSSGYLAIFRCMTTEELEVFYQNQDEDRVRLSEGRLVFDLLPASPM